MEDIIIEVNKYYKSDIELEEKQNLIFLKKIYAIKLDMDNIVVNEINKERNFFFLEKQKLLKLTCQTRLEKIKELYEDVGGWIVKLKKSRYGLSLYIFKENVVVLEELGNSILLKFKFCMYIFDSFNELSIESYERTIGAITKKISDEILKSKRRIQGDIKGKRIIEHRKYQDAKVLKVINNSGNESVCLKKMGIDSLSIYIDELIRFKEINLLGNSINRIPKEIGNLKNLEKLSLSNNNLEGNIPEELCNLINLNSLDLYGNKLSGKIPKEIGNLKNLEKLSLSNNNLEGKIPEQLCNLVNLKLLYLSDNKLSGKIPKEIGNLKNLEELLLWDNNLEGKIPEQLCNLVNLKLLYLHSNKLSGKIPIEIGNLKNLEALSLSSNNLEGNIPESFLKLKKLTRCTLKNNKDIDISFEYFNNLINEFIRKSLASFHQDEIMNNKELKIVFALSIYQNLYIEIEILIKEAYSNYKVIETINELHRNFPNDRFDQELYNFCIANNLNLYRIFSNTFKYYEAL